MAIVYATNIFVLFEIKGNASVRFKGNAPTRHQWPNGCRWGPMEGTCICIFPQSKLEFAERQVARLQEELQQAEVCSVGCLSLMIKRVSTNDT